MGERPIFLDTSGIFAWINVRDPHHKVMLSLPRERGVKLVVTDYIVDEACTLFVARNIAHRRDDLLKLIQHSRIVRMEWVGQEVFWQAWEWQRKFHDHSFSFTDCTSFAVMKRLGLSEVATNDTHFQTAGFQPLERFTPWRCSIDPRHLKAVGGAYAWTDSAKAKSELGYTCRNARISIEDAVNRLRSHAMPP